MRGPLFRKLIRQGEIKLSYYESLPDLEMMYTILVNSRGKSIYTLTEFDEKITFGVLCKVIFPGKKPKYSQQVERLKSGFEGISINRVKQAKFKGMISSKFKNATSEKDVDLSDIRNVFIG